MPSISRTGVAIGGIFGLHRNRLVPAPHLDTLDLLTGEFNGEAAIPIYYKWFTSRYWLTLATGDRRPFAGKTDILLSVSLLIRFLKLVALLFIKLIEATMTR